ncbi:MAG: GatB/YqeY domain-containing protein [Bacteroidia bacterium]
MALLDKINEDLKQAMREKDQARLRGLRAIKAELLLAQTEKGGTNKIDEKKELQMLQKLAKQRKESLEVYEQQGRPELAQDEKEELEVIQEYLPKQMAEDEVRERLREIISKSGARDASEMGKVMPLAMKELGGKTDGKTISRIAGELLKG